MPDPMASTTDYATCPKCGSEVMLTRCGALRVHGPVGVRCPGSGTVPVDPNAPPVEAAVIRIRRALDGINDALESIRVARDHLAPASAEPLGDIDSHLIDAAFALRGARDRAVKALS